MEWLTKNFAVVSAVVVLGAATVSVLFLLSYLVVFDWTLIWLVEYSDLTKLFLIFGALIGGFVITTLCLWQSYSHGKTIGSRYKIAGFGIFGALVLIFLGVDIYHDFRAQNGLVLYHCEVAICEFGFLFVLFLIFDTSSRLINGDWPWIVQVMAFALTMVPVAGRTYGTFVREVAEPHVIWSRHEEFQNARVIMWFSHHVAFYADKKVIVLPTGDVVQMELREPK